MEDSSEDDRITVKVIYKSYGWRLYGWRDGLASVFITREGRDPTLAEIQLEYDRAEAAARRDFDTTAQRLLEETGMKPNKYEIWDTLELQLKDPEHNSEYAVYHRWDQNPSYPANSTLPTSRSNPIDLTKSDQSATKTSTKKHDTDLRQTNAGAVRSSPPLSSHLSSLSIVNQTKQGSVLEPTSSQPTELPSKVHLQTYLATQMPEVGRRKVKAVPKEPAMSTPSSKDAGRRPTTEAAAKTATEPTTKTSSQPLRKKHTADTRLIVQSKSSPLPESTPRFSSQTLSARERWKNVSTTDKPQISARPFVRNHMRAPLSSDAYEQLDSIPESTWALPSGTSIFNDKPMFKVSQPHLDPASSRQPAPTPTSKQSLNDSVPTVSASLCKSS